MGLQERARLDGRVAKWCTIQLLDAASRSAARAQIALPPRGCVDGRLPPRIAARTIRMLCIILMIQERIFRCRDCGVRRVSRGIAVGKIKKTLRTAAAAPRWIGSGARSSLTLTGVGGDGVGGDGDGGVVGGGGGGAGVGIAAPARSYVDGLLWLLLLVALSSAKHMGGVGAACMRDVMVLVGVVLR